MPFGKFKTNRIVLIHAFWAATDVNEHALNRVRCGIEHI